MRSTYRIALRQYIELRSNISSCRKAIYRVRSTYRVSVADRFPLKPWGLLLCPERQSKQNALLPKRSEENHLAVIFLISPLCFLGSVLPHLCFKERLYKISSLVYAFTKLSPSSATLRCLNSLPSHYPTVDGRWQVLCFGFDSVGLILLTIYLVLQITLASLSEGGGKA